MGGGAEAIAQAINSFRPRRSAAVRRLQTYRGRSTHRAKAIPAKALKDSLHIAVSAVHGIDYLLTWNFQHIDNVEIKPVIRRICIMYGYTSPEICTPQELMGDFKNA